VQGQGCSWRVAFTDDFPTTLKPTRFRSKSEARMGHP